MGIGITGMSKAKLHPCRGDESCDPECIEEHLTVGKPGSGKDAVKMGCYVPGRGGRTSDMDFGYGGYSTWAASQPSRPRCRAGRSLATFPPLQGQAVRRAHHLSGYRRRCDRPRHFGQAIRRLCHIRIQGEEVLRDALGATSRPSRRRSAITDRQATPQPSWLGSHYGTG
jgi:hypothetical protein